MNTPRTPTALELDQLTRALLMGSNGGAADFDQEEFANTRQLVDTAAVAVFDDYAAEMPGFVGKLLMLVWPSRPDRYEVFIWRHDQPVSVAQDVLIYPQTETYQPPAHQAFIG